MLWFQNKSSEYTRFLNILGLHKVLNKLFRDRCLAIFWICLGFWICWGHTRLWIKFSIINIWQGSEYASSSENISITHGSVENSPSYMFDRFLSISWALSLPGLAYTRVVNKPRLHMFLRKLYFKDSQ